MVFVEGFHSIPLLSVTSIFYLSIANFSDGKKLFGGYKITPKFCTDTKTSKADAKINGPAICMFNHECVARKGTVIGACMDG